MGRYKSYNALIGIFVAVALSGLVAFSVATGQMNNHVQEVRIHKGVEELTADFMPRESLDIQIQALIDQTESLKKQISRMESILNRIDKPGAD